MSKSRISVEQFIATGFSSGDAGSRITFSEYRTDSGIGGGTWEKTGNTGTASQSPADTLDRTLFDSEGYEWQLMSTDLGLYQLGAYGDATNDDYAVIQAYGNYLTALSKSENMVTYMRIDAGDYLMTQKATFDVENGAGPRGITFIGDSMHNTRIIADASNTDGCIECTSDGNIELWEVRNISFLSPLAYDSTTNNGTALRIASTLGPDDDGFGSQPNRTVMIENVFVGPYGTTISEINGGEYGNFDTGIEVQNKWWPYFDNVYLRGCSELLLADTYGRTYGINCINCYSPEFIKIQATGWWHYGIYCDADTEEDFRLQDSFLVNQHIGFSMIHPTDVADNTLYEPGGTIKNCHINSRNTGVHIRYHRQIVIEGNYFYVPRGNGLNQLETGLPSSIWLEGGEDVLVANNEFLEPGFYVDDSNTSVGIKCTHRGNGNVYQGNHFNCGGTGVYLGGSLVSVNVLNGNTYGGPNSTWTITNRLLDNTNIAVVLNETDNSNTSYLENTMAKTSKTPDAAVTAIRTYYQNERTDYATNSSYQMVDKYHQGLASDGTTLSIVNSYRCDDNDATTPIMAYRHYMTTSVGLSQLFGVVTPTTTDDDTSVVISYWNGTAFVSKTIKIGEEDSAATGYRMLMVSN